MSKPKTAKEFWADAEKRSANLNRAFVEIQQGPNPLTPEEIRILVDKRPDQYGRFEGFAAPKK